MPLSSLPSSTISEEHLQRLVADGVSEGPTLDAKLVLPGASDDDKKEYLRDVSAFANANGGDLLYGVKDENGIITAVPGMELQDVESEILRLSQLARDCIDPRIFNLTISPIRLESGKAVLLVRVPQSIDSPHMITFKRINQFWIRQNTGKAPMTTSDVRNSVLRTFGWRERLRKVHSDRMEALVVGEGPILLMDGPLLFVQTLPLSEPTGLDLSTPVIRDQLIRLGPPMHGGGYNHWYTFDGFLLAPSQPNQATYSFRLCCHDGMVEAVRVDYHMPDDAAQQQRISIESLEGQIVALFDGNIKALQAMGVLPPIAVLVSIRGIRGAVFVRQHDDRHDIAERLAVTRDPLPLPHVVLHEYPADSRDALSLILTRLWQTAGFASAPRPRS